MQAINIGVLGLGVVGSGTINVLMRNRDEIMRRVGHEINILLGSARNINKPELQNHNLQLTTDPFEVVNHPDVDIVVELIGGTGIAKELVEQAIKNGKSIVTANKALIAQHGTEVFALASKYAVDIAYEASVAGGIPVIKAIREGLAGNRIEWLTGIINGTGNFILTEMQQKGRNFAEVLQEAQALGYAEADPTFDIEGIDAAHKLTILASIAFGIPLNFSKTYTEGISQITTKDIRYSRKLGYCIKHLGIARKTSAGIEMRVHPTLIPQTQLIANVNGVMNAVMVKTDALGPTMYYGPGAGSEPTASAVVADIIDLARRGIDTDSACRCRVPHMGYQTASIEQQTIIDIKDVQSAYYLRLSSSDPKVAMAKVNHLANETGTSIEILAEQETIDGNTDITVISGVMQEKQLNQWIDQLQALDVLESDVIRIRIERLD